MNPHSLSDSISCGGCQCWCDDIQATDSEQKWLNACSLGTKWLELQTTKVKSNAKADTESLQHTANLPAQIAQKLQSAQQPAIFGLVDCDIDSQRWAMAIADRVGGIIDPQLSPAARAKTLALQQAGEITATWGEIKNRATSILYWNCSLDAAPRFRQRYGDLADSCFDIQHRNVAVVGDQPTLQQWPDDVKKIECDTDHLLLDLLSKESDTTGWVADQVRSMFKPGCYSAVVVGQASMKKNLTARQIAYEKLTQWIGSQNQNQRMVMVPFGSGRGNATGIQSVMTWRCGYPMSVDFASHRPKYFPKERTWENVLRNNSTDCVLWVGEIDQQANIALSRWQKNNPSSCLIHIGPDSDEASLGSKALPSIRLSTTSAPSGISPAKRCMFQRPDHVIVSCSLLATDMAEQLNQIFNLIQQKKTELAGQAV